MHVTALSSGHLCNLDNYAHKVSQDKDAGSHFICSWGIVFVPAKIASIVLDFSVDSLDDSITKVA